MDKYINQIEPEFDEKEAIACYKYLNTNMWLTEYKKTREFESIIAKYTGSKYCNIVSNGTISLSISLLAFDIKPGDKVIVPNLTFIASANAIRLLGAKPILVDVEEETLCLNIEKTEELIKQGDIKGVIHVSLNGRCNNIEKLVTICKKNNVYLLEDAAQCLGSKHNNKQLGTFGDIGSFSFSTPKIISTGQGGAIITDNKELYEKIIKIKNFGRIKDGVDNHVIFGINAKTTDIQSVIGIEQMKKLEWRIKRKKEIWNIYYNELKNNPKIKMLKYNPEGWIPLFVDIYIDDPIKLANYLKENNIGTRLVYPAIHTQKVYKEYNNLSYPNADKYSKAGLWLPSSVTLTDKNIKDICEYINKYKINIK
jgi:perosamine synthetase